MFFKVMFLVILLWSGDTYAQVEITSEKEEKSPQTVQAVDPNAPAPEAQVKIRIPHSERTKGNVLDATLDFLFSRSLKKIEDMDITYDFFEVGSEYDLIFKNFKIDLKRSDAKGLIKMQKLVINFTEFMEFLKSKKIASSKIIAEKVLIDLKLIKQVDIQETNQAQKEGNKQTAATTKTKETSRQLKFSADELLLKNVFFIFLKNEVRDGKENDIETVIGKGIRASLSNPKEKYAVSEVELNGVVLPNSVVKRVRIASAKVKGKEYKDIDSFLKAIRQQ